MHHLRTIALPAARRGSSRPLFPSPRVQGTFLNSVRPISTSLVLHAAKKDSPQAKRTTTKQPKANDGKPIAEKPASMPVESQLKATTTTATTPKKQPVVEQKKKKATSKDEAPAMPKTTKKSKKATTAAEPVEEKKATAAEPKKRGRKPAQKAQADGLEEDPFAELDAGRIDSVSGHEGTEAQVDKWILDATKMSVISDDDDEDYDDDDDIVEHSESKGERLQGFLHALNQVAKPEFVEENRWALFQLSDGEPQPLGTYKDELDAMAAYNYGEEEEPKKTKKKKATPAATEKAPRKERREERKTKEKVAKAEKAEQAEEKKLMAKVAAKAKAAKAVADPAAPAAEKANKKTTSASTTKKTAGTKVRAGKGKEEELK